MSKGRHFERNWGKFVFNDIEIRYLKSKGVANNLYSIVVRGDLYIVDTILIVRIVQGELRRCEHTVQISKNVLELLENMMQEHRLMENMMQEHHGKLFYDVSNNKIVH